MFVNEARCQKPGVRKLPGKQGSGPQRAVNAEQASSDSHPKGVQEGRAAHVTAKATAHGADDNARDPDRALALLGVLAAARSEGSMCNRRGPTRSPSSGEATRIRPTAESGECREGVRGGRSTDEGGDKPLEGRTPASVALAQRHTRAWSNGPKDPIDKVRRLQRKLYEAAERSSTRRFHALFDRIYRDDVLWRAWELVRSNGGAAGIDGKTIDAIEESGVPDFLPCEHPVGSPGRTVSPASGEAGVHPEE